MNRNSIFHSLLWQISIPLLGVLLFIGLVGIFIFHITIQTSLNKQLRQTAEIAAHSVQFSVESSIRQNAIQRYISALGAEPDIDLIIVAAGNPLKVIASTRMSEIGKPIDELPDVYLKNTIKEVQKNNISVNQFQQKDRITYSYALPTILTNIKELDYRQSIGVIYVEIGTKQHESSLRNFSIQVNGFFVTILFVLIIILTLIIESKILRPQQKILATLTRRKNGEKVFCTDLQKNEIGRIGYSINQLLAHSDQVEALKAQFVSTVSHELRTPLTSIRGSLGLLVQLEKLGKTDKNQNILEIASRNAEHLTNLINDLLDIEKLRDSSFRLNSSLINLVEVTYKSIESIQNYAEQHQVKIIAHHSVNPITVFADEHRLHQVFSNLLSNAIKFSKPKDCIAVLLIVKSNQAHVSILDQGKGIPESFASKIFSRFSQADSSDAREKGGTGLGLSIVKTIVEKHGGSIGYQSKEGEGTRFFFSLPLADSSSPEPYRESEK